MKNKNFKCLNNTCGISYKDELLGPCPVCGSDNTKLESKKWSFLLLFILLILGGAIVFTYLKTENSNDILNPDEILVLKCDTSKLDLFDIEFDCEKQTVLMSISGYNEDSCGLLKYSINNEEITDTNFIKIKNIKTDSLLIIKLYNENNEQIKSFDWLNTCYLPKTKCSVKDSLVLVFQNSFKSFLNDPSNTNRISKLKSLAKKIGFLNKNIATNFDKNSSNIKLITLINRVSKIRQFQNKKTKILGDFEIELDNSSLCSVAIVKVALKTF